MDENEYYNYRKVSENETELYIYGNIEKRDWLEQWLEIGQDKTNVYTLKDLLAKIDTPVLTVRINSYGGEVDEGLAIYSLLSDWNGKVRTIVDGMACSAASVIFMAGEERIVPENGLLMIHNAWAEAQGDSNVMKKMAEDLEKITQPSVNIYVLRTGLSEEKVKEMMDKETWITAKEAYDLGFSTTMQRENAKQSLECNYVFNLVNQIKSSEKEIATKDTLIGQLNDKISKLEEKVAGLNNEPKNSWAKYF